MSEPPNKKAKLNSQEESQEVDKKVQKALEDVDTVQEEIEKLNEKEQTEITEIEKKYSKLRAPHYEKRDKIIQSIPGFYCEVFQNHSDLGDLMQEADIEVMEYCTYINVEEDKDNSSFKIVFHFKENPFFTDKELVKQVTYDPLRSVSGVEIHWNKGKIPKSITENKSEDEPTNSFLLWLTKDSDDDEIADTIKNEIYAHPLESYMDVEDDDEDDEEGADEAEEDKE